MGRIKRIAGNKYFKRIAPLVVMTLTALVAFITCMHWQPPPMSALVPVIVAAPTPTPFPTPTPTPTPTPEPEPEPYTGPVNPLTGLPTEEDLTQNRPLAIVINNIRESLPQVGVSKADIIFEVPVEGGITRMLALYQDVSNVGIIGSVRSARLYYVDIAQSFDAILIFAGGSPQAYSALRSRNITRFDGVAGPQSEIFYRDPNRRHMSSEHRLVTSGARIMEHFPTYEDVRFEHEEGYERALTFAEDGTPENGLPALAFEVKFTTGSKTTSFAYNEDDSLYYIDQYNRAFIDGNDNSQLAVTNVLILRTSVSGISGDREGRLNVATTGSGTGYFVCGGKYVEIEWSRADDSSQFIYTLKDGSELVLGQGQTYICIVSNNMEIEFS